jgi:hypothetical protein
MTTFILPTQLPSLYELQKVRESKIKFLINNLKYQDTKSDDVFDRTKKKIKKEILLTPVVFNEPSFLDHTYEERSVSFPNQLTGGARDHYVHNISVIFNGDRELFNYIPNNFSFGISERGIVQPDYNQILIDIDLPELNPNLAIQNAKSMLSSTYRLIEMNNSVIAEWSKNVEKRIDDQLDLKRKELENLFGKNK